MSLKNPGKKLFFSRYGGEQPIPPEFIAAMERHEEVQAVPNEVGPEALSDTIVQSEVKTNREGERVRSTVKKKAGNVGPLLVIHTNDQGQPVQVSRLLYPTGSGLSATPNEYTTVAVQDLGNGWSIEEVGVEGTYVDDEFIPGIFSGNVFERERLNLVPEKFRSTIQTITTRVDSAGTAVDPTLSGTELSERQEQLTISKKRTTIATQAAPSLPVTLDKGRDTNEKGQDVTVSEKLIADGTTADTATAVKDVKVDQLGDGNKVQTTREVSTVFDEKVYAKERPDNIPERFKANIPAITEKHSVAGTAAAPSLSTGDIAKSERQIKVAVKETSVTNRDVGSLATLHGQEIQPRLGLTLPYEEEVEIEGFSGGAVTEIEPIGGTLVRLKTYDTSALLSYSKIFVGMTRLEVPPVLTDLDPFFDYREGAGDFTGSVSDCHWIGAGSWSYSLRGEGQGSAAVVAHVKHSVQQKWGGYTQTQRVVFFLTPPVSAANITTKLTALLGATVSFMPSFDPTSVSVLLVSNAVSLRAEAQEHVQDGGSGDDNEEHSEYGGSGSSREHSLTIESLNIPPTLHSSFSETVSDGFSLGANASADAGSESSSPGSEAVSASVKITGPASSPTALPTGLHIVALDPEIFYDKIMYHAEVVDM